MAEETVNGSTRRLLFQILGGLTLAGVGGLVALATWKGSTDAALDDLSHLERDVGTSLRVLADHGTELAQLRGALENVRGELTATLLAIDSAAGDRFRRTEWEAEARAIDIRFKACETAIVRLERLLEKR